MTEINYKKITLIIVAIFVVVFLAIIFIFWHRLVFPDNYRMFNIDSGENLQLNMPLGEKFTATDNNLTQLNILMENLDKIQDGDNIKVSILDDKCQKTIRTTKMEWPPAAPKQYSLFSFDPITDSKGQLYCFSVLYTSAYNKKSLPQVDKMKNTGDPNDQYVNLKTGQTFPEQTFIFRPAYKYSATYTLGELNRRMSAYKADYLKGNSIYLIFAGFIIFSVLLVLVFLLL